MNGHYPEGCECVPHHYQNAAFYHEDMEVCAKGGSKMQTL